MAVHQDKPKLLEEKKKRAFHIWDIEGVDFSIMNIQRRLNVGYTMAIKWLEEYKKEKGL